MRWLPLASLALLAATTRGSDVHGPDTCGSEESEEWSCLQTSAHNGAGRPPRLKWQRQGQRRKGPPPIPKPCARKKSRRGKGKGLRKARSTGPFLCHAGASKRYLYKQLQSALSRPPAYTFDDAVKSLSDASCSDCASFMKTLRNESVPAVRMYTSDTAPMHQCTCDNGGPWYKLQQSLILEDDPRGIKKIFPMIMRTLQGINMTGYHEKWKQLYHGGTKPTPEKLDMLKNAINKSGEAGVVFYQDFMSTSWSLKSACGFALDWIWKIHLPDRFYRDAMNVKPVSFFPVENEILWKTYQGFRVLAVHEEDLWGELEPVPSA